MVPDDFNFGVVEQPLLEDFFGSECIAAVDEKDPLGVMRQVERFFDRSIPASDDGNPPVTVKEPIAGRDILSPKFKGLFRIPNPA